MPYKDPKRQSAATLSFKKKKLAWIASLKMMRGCDVCGYMGSPVALQYHHKSSDRKEQDISRMANSNRSESDILAEIEKCDLLCANCHAVAHGFSYKEI